jgi:hypothetical protein
MKDIQCQVQKVFKDEIEQFVDRDKVQTQIMYESSTDWFRGRSSTASRLLAYAILSWVVLGISIAIIAQILLSK